MHTYKYCLDGIDHTITSQGLIETADKNGIIPISRDQNKIARQLKQLLKEWIRLADKNNIAWFCNGGTLLGAIRDKGLIHYDNDIDLVVFLQDFHKIKNMSCGDKYEIDYCEQGFQFHFKDKMFPFIDLWVEAPNPNDPDKIIIAAPILDDGRPSYLGNIIWSNDNFYCADVLPKCAGAVSPLVKVKFEGLTVNVPRHGERYLRKMYGDDCLTRYVVQTHTDNHWLCDILPQPKFRMGLINMLNKIDNQKTVISKVVNLFFTLIFNEYATSDKDKNNRHLDIIKRHICERYLGAKPPFGV